MSAGPNKTPPGLNSPRPRVGRVRAIAIAVLAIAAAVAGVAEAFGVELPAWMVETWRAVQPFIATASGVQ